MHYTLWGRILPEPLAESQRVFQFRILERAGGWELKKFVRKQKHAPRVAKPALIENGSTFLQLFPR